MKALGVLSAFACSMLLCAPTAGALGLNLPQVDIIRGSNNGVETIVGVGQSNLNTEITLPHEATSGGNIVAVGDSYFADSALFGLAGRCGHNRDGIPHLFAEKVGLPVSDYSCSAAIATPVPAASASAQLRTAKRDGALNPETKYVVMSIGGNDSIAGGLTPSAMRHQMLRSSLQDMVGIIREVAPGARIMLVGYPEVFGGNLCPVHTSFSDGVKVPVRILNKREIAINDSQRDISRELGIDFVDVKPSSAGHGLCASNEERWVSGAIDTGVMDTYTMPLHMTSKGNENTAQAMYEVATR